ncbi:MAG: cupin domain-containing protein [Alphaproteobacteria bacterium]|nr:cupin domain-containing protein [Alphaproteobacteria bacterium]
MRPVIQLNKLSLEPQTHGENFEAKFAPITTEAGAKRLGARYVEVPPGKRAWPYHAHHENDEIFVILGGAGQLRLGKEKFTVSSGDVVVCPAGGAETAHQLIAEGNEALRYVAISSMHVPDVLEYPDSNKLRVFVGSAPGGDKAARRLELTFMKNDTVGYWEGEK